MEVLLAGLLVAALGACCALPFLAGAAALKRNSARRSQANPSGEGKAGIVAPHGLKGPQLENDLSPGKESE